MKIPEEFQKKWPIVVSEWQKYLSYAFFIGIALFFIHLPYIDRYVGYMVVNDTHTWMIGALALGYDHNMFNYFQSPGLSVILAPIYGLIFLYQSVLGNVNSIDDCSIYFFANVEMFEYVIYAVNLFLLSMLFGVLVRKIKMSWGGVYAFALCFLLLFNFASQEEAFNRQEEALFVTLTAFAMIWLASRLSVSAMIDQSWKWPLLGIGAILGAATMAKYNGIVFSGTIFAFCFMAVILKNCEKKQGVRSCFYMILGYLIGINIAFPWFVFHIYDMGYNVYIQVFGYPRFDSPVDNISENSVVLANLFHPFNLFLAMLGVLYFLKKSFKASVLFFTLVAPLCLGIIFNRVPYPLLFTPFLAWLSIAGARAIVKYATARFQLSTKSELVSKVLVVLVVCACQLSVWIKTSRLSWEEDKITETYSEILKNVPAGSKIYSDDRFFNLEAHSYPESVRKLWRSRMRSPMLKAQKKTATRKMELYIKGLEAQKRYPKYNVFFYSMPWIANITSDYAEEFNYISHEKLDFQNLVQKGYKVFILVRDEPNYSLREDWRKFRKSVLKECNRITQYLYILKEKKETKEE